MASDRMGHRAGRRTPGEQASGGGDSADVPAAAGGDAVTVVTQLVVVRLNRPSKGSAPPTPVTGSSSTDPLTPTQRVILALLDIPLRCPNGGTNPQPMRKRASRRTRRDTPTDDAGRATFAFGPRLRPPVRRCASTSGLPTSWSLTTRQRPHERMCTPGAGLEPATFALQELTG